MLKTAPVNELSSEAAAPRDDAFEASVVIATYQRHEGLVRLLSLLEKQTVSPASYEVIVVDDGSKVPLSLPGYAPPYAFQILRQENAGPGAARHRGAQAARGRVLVIVDDDMQITEGFIEGHLKAHPRGTRRAALGPIEPDARIGAGRLFEHWNSDRLFRVSKAGVAGTKLRGNNMWSGNVSVDRADYLAVGGFDPSLRVSEDLELGLRLEESGVEIVFAEEAKAVHESDHPDETWFRRAATCGQADKRVSRKHPDALHADPWRYYYLLPGAVRPFLDLEIALPAVGTAVARGFLGVGRIALALGMRKLGIKLAAVVWAGEYFRGVRLVEGSRRASHDSLRRYLARCTELPELPPEIPRRTACWERLKADLAKDHAMRASYEEKYRYAGQRGMERLSSFVQKIGVQLMTAIRVMSFFRDSRHPLLARFTSRAIRHLYGSDVHWDAQWAPGVILVHGFGLAISNAARIGEGCILFQNVCLGMGHDGVRGVSGAPTLGAFVQVGPGAVLLGPITVGDRSKVMGGVVLRESVPEGSLVEAPAPRIVPRARSSDPDEGNLPNPAGGSVPNPGGGSVQ